MREHVFEVAVDDEIHAKLEEMTYLERSIGPTGRRALAPLLHPTSREHWQLTLLGK